LSQSGKRANTLEKEVAKLKVQVSVRPENVDKPIVVYDQSNWDDGSVYG